MNNRICADCVHYAACASWNVGSIASMDATHCVNYDQHCVQNQWRSVRDKLPEKGEIVLCVDEFGYLHVADFTVGKLWNEQDAWFYVDGEYDNTIVAWCPVPDGYAEWENKNVE